MNPVIFAYKESSKTSKKIASALSCPRHWPGSDYVWNANDLVINWGCGSPLGLPNGARILNKYKFVNRSVNKKIAFDFFRNYDVLIPKVTSFKELAQRWLNEGQIVFERHSLEGHNGSGIKIIRPGEQLSSMSSLYTQFVNNEREFRVHVFGNEVIFFTEKVIARDAGQNPNSMIKSGDDWAMGWVDSIPEVVSREAIKATKALELDFAAVDIGYSSSPDRAWVFETNTAPGAFGPVTLHKYAEAIRRACV